MLLLVCDKARFERGVAEGYVTLLRPDLCYWERVRPLLLVVDHKRKCIFI